MGETILKMQGIQKYFSGVHALKSVNFDLRAGEVHALMGENGAGKSTLMNILTGVHRLDKGSVTFDGKDITNCSIAESEAMGIAFVHQELNLFNDLTVYENIAFPLKIKKLSKDEIDRKVKLEKLVKEAANEHNELKKAYTDLARSATFEDKGVEKVNSEPKNEPRTFEEALRDFAKRQKK